MKRWLSILAAIAALTALSLTSPLGAAPDAAKMPLRILTIVEGNLLLSGTASGKFTLELSASTDAGKFTLKYTYGGVLRTGAGLTFRPGEHTETFRGKYGTLVIHSTGRRFLVGVVSPKDPHGESEVWMGTWSIVSGTGRYAGLKGGGGVAGIIEYSGHGTLSFDYLHRYEGFVTRS
jgi:hypothetical protein